MSTMQELLDSYKAKRKNMSATSISSIGHNTVIYLLSTYDARQARNMLIQKRDINLANLAAHKEKEWDDAELAQTVELAMRSRISLYNKVIKQIEGTQEYKDVLQNKAGEEKGL